jgi:hypothetical protein
MGNKDLGGTKVSEAIVSKSENSLNSLNSYFVKIRVETMQNYLDIAKQALQQRKDEATGGETSGTNYEFNEVNNHGRLSDGQPPPLDRPPKTERELRRLFDYWEADPEVFTRWLEWAMAYTEAAEGHQGCE